jgi:putative transposase
MTYKHNLNVTYSSKYHVVWCTKWRRKLITPDVEKRLREIISLVAETTRSDVIEMEVMPDHVHILVEVDPQFGIHRYVKMTKGRSSRLLRLEFPPLKSRVPTLWTNSYFVSTVGGAPLEEIKKYILNQKNT